MKSVRKNWKTSIVAIVGVLSLAVNIVLLYLGKITATDFGIIMSSIGTFLLVLIGLFAKDGDKTGI